MTITSNSSAICILLDRDGRPRGDDAPLIGGQSRAEPSRYDRVPGGCEVGRIFKVTLERVRQIEAKAIRKLQHPIRSRKLEGFLEGILRKSAEEAKEAPVE